MRLAGYLAPTVEKRNTGCVMVEKAEGKRALGRLTHR